MGVWHWYCERHGQIDRACAKVSRNGSTQVGRCARCETTVVGTDRRPASCTQTDHQLTLFEDAS